MKSPSKSPSPLLLIYKNKKSNNFLCFALSIAIILLSFVNCSYYKTRDINTNETELKEYVINNKGQYNYFIIHGMYEKMLLGNIVIDEEEQVISGRLYNLPDDKHYSKYRENRKTYRYDKTISEPLNDLHVYTNKGSRLIAGNAISIPFTDIARISVNDKNTGRSVVDVIFGIVGLFALATIIYFATKSSCPYAYVQDGDEFKFAGELYPGVITANMQRDDYLQLPKINCINETFTIRINNELKEIQYTDLIELISIEHPSNVDVFIDSKGNIHTMSNLIPPSQTSLPEYYTEEKVLDNKDQLFYAFDTEKLNENHIAELILTFKNVEHANNAKLQLTLKNSLWMDYVFGKFNEKFGSYYNAFQQKQQNVSKEEIESWLIEQHIPLSVYIKIANEWQLVENLMPVGPLATRDLVIPLDLSMLNEKEVQIKLNTGYRFWELDYAGIDFSENINLKSKTHKPTMATDHLGNDVTTLLSNSDNIYFVQPNIGDEVHINFDIENQSMTDLTSSYFIKSRGYYNYVRNYTGKPNKHELEKFKEKEYFTKFARIEYDRINQTKGLLELAWNYE